MEPLHLILDFVLHIDRYLVDIVNQYQYWTYFILFIIVFAETGLVVIPFLPGDSVLFAMGALIVKPDTDLNIFYMLLVLILAAVLGDFVNYEIGKYLGDKVFKADSKIFKQSYLQKTESFYKKHGTKTIIYARFIPIVRTFAPFVAGISKMSYGQFGKYNIIGGVSWVSLFLFGGYFFGKIPTIEKNFSFVALLIVIISITPAFIQLFKSKKS